MPDLLACQGPDCDVRFEPKRSTARYCSATCRQRAGRQRKAATAEAAAEKDAGSGKEHSLVKAVRRDLEKAQAIDTVAGQLALQAARRIANPEEAGFAQMSKELRSLLAEAKAEGVPAVGADPSPAAAAEPEEDEVTKARRRREEIESAAASAAAEAEA